MRLSFYILIFISFNLLSINQTFSQCANTCGPNLVPNGDFETPSINCSGTISELFYNYTSLEHWYGTDEWSCYPQPPSDCNAGSTPDYHNSNCNGSANDVGCGSGNGAIGLFTSTNVEGQLVFGGTVSQNREYVQVKLNTPLEAGKQYCASMVVKSSYPSPINVSSDGIGMWFTDQKVNIDTQNSGEQFIGPGSIINASAQVQNPPGNIIDSTCTIVSGTFCANGGEEWLVIGNFLEDVNMSTNDPLGFFLTPNYMVIDDVNVQTVCEPNPSLSISNNSIYCGTPINVEVTDTDPTANFEWLSPTNFTSNTSTGPFTDTPQDDTDYTVVVTTDNGCGTIFFDTLTASVLVECGPEIELNLTSDTICQGSCTDINAIISSGQSPYTISWSHGISNGAGPHSVCPTNTTTYQATVTDANGDSKDTTITVYVGSPDSTYQLHPICDGSSITLYGTTYNSNGVYSETFTNIYGCDSIEYNEVVVLPSESNINITSTNLTDCNLSNGTISFSGLIPDSTYSISYDNNGVVGPNNYTANSSGEITVSGLDIGSYTDFTISILGCSTTLTDQVTITSPNTPSVSAGSDIETCENESITLSVTPSTGETVTWDNGVTNGIPFNPPADTTIYTVTLTNASGCTATDEVMVVAKPLPSIDAGQNNDICEGASTTLTANGGISYVWSPAAGLNTTTGSTVIANPSSTTTYTVTGTGSNGCENTDQITVNINPLPNIDAGSDEIICQGESINISATGGNNYSWSPATGLNTTSGNSVMSTPTNTQTYTVTGTDANGCSNSDQITITVNPLPTVNTIQDTAICEESSIMINAHGADTYVWSPSTGLNTTVGATVEASPSNTQTYTVTGTDNNGCENTDQVTITLNQNPTLNIGQDITACEGEEVILNINGNDTYSWSQGVNNGIPFTPSLGTNTYTVTAIDQNGCETIDSIKVTVYENANASIFTNDSLGCAPFTVEFSSGSSNPGEQCFWGLGDGTTITGCGTISHTFENPGTYDISLTQIHGATNCSNSITEENLIIVGEVPVASFNYSPHNPSEENPLVQFVNQSSAANSYIWTFNDSTQSNETDPTHLFPDESGVYEVQLIASSNAGCNDTTDLKIFIDESLRYYVPNTFTPDDNSHNDMFLPIMTSGFDPMNYKMMIFNRWGELIFETQNPLFGWDGKYKDKIVPDGTYIWILEFRDNNTEEIIIDKGHVNLVR